MKNSISIIIFILVAALAIAYLFFQGSEEEIQRPTRISKRVKIDVPPPTVINPDETASSDAFVIEENEELIIEETADDPKPEVVLQKKEESAFQMEVEPAEEPVKRAEKVVVFVISHCGFSIP